ncbi:KH domain-containing protein At4g18375-like [Andrographis paniculata]|uniref:KH domain-containing protein At4g18375-like n=1 Tax=Andrographis paniculata TaxID=175694 RepID=UPI0021E73EBC|nr:KH domain-containing protein At4g18375-like [Andrographis paniculata]XP_051122181.1 KH domain-containing protein At4g18375-like [Andrographis paniculata]
MGQRSDYGKVLSEYSGTEGGKRRNVSDENLIGPEYTVYRYLCPLRKIGSIIGIGGDIAKQLRAQTQAKIRISETIPGCDERVITIYSVGDETNEYGNEHISAAQDALFRVHDRVVAEESPVNGSLDDPLQVNVRLLVPSDQIGCVIGKGGQIIQSLRNETLAQIRILGSEHLPPCALSSDELIQINGEANVVKNALYHVALRLHENPSRSQQNLLTSPSIYRSGIGYNSPHVGGPPMGVTSLTVPYGNHRSTGIAKEFAIRIVCPVENLGAVIGKGGAIIKQTRQESGAFIVVDSSGADEDDCIISISSREVLEAPSRTIDAAVRLQPRCSEKILRESGDPVITTRLLIPSSRIGCVIGKGGAIIKEIRSTSRASIRIFTDENVPKVALEDDGMVQIIADANAAKNALLQVLQRLRANVFETDGNLPAFSPPVPPLADEAFNGPKYANCGDSRARNQGYSAYAGSYGAKPSPPPNSYGAYDNSQIVGGSGYGDYAGYPSGHSPGASYGA